MHQALVRSEPSERGEAERRDKRQGEAFSPPSNSGKGPTLGPQPHQVSVYSPVSTCGQVGE